MRPPGILHDDTVTIVQVTYTGDTDDSGVPIPDETTSLEWERVNVQQETTTERHVDGRNTIFTTFRVSGPIPLLEPVENDLIVWNGVEYQVDGQPDTRRGRHRINHTSLTMSRARG